MSPVDLPRILAQSNADLGDEMACARVLKGYKLREPLIAIRAAASNIRVATAIARRHGERFVSECRHELSSFVWGIAAGFIVFAVCYGATL